MLKSVAIVKTFTLDSFLIFFLAFFKSFLPLRERCTPSLANCNAQPNPNPLLDPLQVLLYHLYLNPN